MNNLRQFPDPPARLHLVGIKGVGMTALAELLKAQGYDVSGSDTMEIFPTDKVLKNLDITVAEGFDAGHIGANVDVVIYSTVYGPDNIERVTARELSLSEWSYPETVGLLFSLFDERVAVAGTHGKTTVTILLSQMLEEGGCDPTALVGAPVTSWGRNARPGRGRWFVLEADEYQNKFQYYNPNNLIVTNVDYDHPDFFKDQTSYDEAFLDFVKKLPEDGILVTRGNDRLVNKFKEVAKAPVVTYGLEENCDWQLLDIKIADGETVFTVFNKKQKFGEFKIPFPGEHYALNAVAAMIVAVRAGVTYEKIQKSLLHYSGASRRLEKYGEVNGAIIIDDYAHHPTEIKATLQSLRRGYSTRRIRLIFQPHTFSRTEKFLDEFAKALSGADEVVLTPIYSSAREQTGNITSQDLADKINKLVPNLAKVGASQNEIISYFKRELKTNDLLITMGAGDIWHIASELIK